MNILLIIEGTYPWYRGGVSEWVYQYLSHLDDHRFGILQIATDEFQDLDPSQALYPLTPNIEEFIRISPPSFTTSQTPNLEQWYRDVKENFSAWTVDYDIIHATNTGFAGWLGSVLAENADNPLLLTEHAIYWKEIEMGAVALECGFKIPQNEQAVAQTTEAFKKLAAQTYQTSDKIVSVSRSNLPFQHQLGAEDVTYIPNGIPEDWLVQEKKRKAEPCIGWVGRCAEMKNPLAFFDYVDAFRSCSITPSFKMLLSDANEKKLQEKVVQTAKSYPEVEIIWNQPSKRFFSDFDFILITSHNESQPLVMLEALAHKVLPVGYQVGDFSKDYGLVFEKHVPVETQAKEIYNLWKSQDELEVQVNQLHRKVREEHTWKQIFSNYDFLMREMTDSHNRSIHE